MSRRVQYRRRRGHAFALTSSVFLLCGLPLLAVGCSTTPTAAEEPAPAVEDRACHDAFFDGATRCEEYLSSCLERLGEKPVIARGRPSDAIAQHLVGHFEEYPHTAYVDIDNDDQIVTYLKDDLDVDIGVSVDFVGTVVVIEGLDKSPASRQRFVEHHLKVDRWCVVK